MSSTSVKPGRAGYLLSAALIVGGWAIVWIFGWIWFGNVADKLDRIVVPAAKGLLEGDPTFEKEMQFTNSGRYMIVQEYRTPPDGKEFSRNRASSFHLRVVSKSTGEEAFLLTLSSGGLSYDESSKAGFQLAYFDIVVPGTYLFKAGYQRGSEGPPIALAIGRDPWDRGFGPMMVSMALMVISLVGAVVVFVVTFLRRRRAMRAAAPTK